MPRRRQHQTDLLAVTAAGQVSRRWLGPAAAAAAVVAVAVLALTVPRLISDSGAARGPRQGEQAITGGPTGPAGRATTDLGNIHLVGVSGPVTVHAGQGSISAAGLAAPRVTMTTELGTIDARFSVPPTLVTAASQDGSVTIWLPSSATYDVAASTQLGRTKVGVPRSASSAHVIRATSQLGSVTVTG